ncbi:MAG TPA: adenylate/guanylate cyclase domain-containing protein [Gaiellaceae bacterium]|nr:adenylate/guanylate cyclase domain-containing protein [Gaiellaceae bacterium]
MRDLPTGTVTFLFSDIEGSTRLLNELGTDRYAAALDEHRRVLREAFARHDGVEVDTQGDAFFVAFPTAQGALQAAADAQERLELPVRMGLHTGTPFRGVEGYVGEDVHRAARIAAAGHGRQVLVSAAAAALLGDDDLRDLGEHRLRDLSAPERIYQLGDEDFPPLNTLYRTNLPIPTTPFLGRNDELAQVHQLLGSDDVRLLTLSGPGGSGKTRLALQAAGFAAGAYPDGAWWVPLAQVSDAAEVMPAAARELGGGGPLEQIVGNRRLLLLFDNFEHVVDAAPEVGRLLSECPHADVLVTSRERLRLQGEQVYPVPALDRAEARELFSARARAVQPDFEPDEHVDDLCARLDDLPLALELAAARTTLLTTGQLLERLGSRLDFLRGARDAELRQRTLQATIEWSYELLTPDEQRLLASLSVFRGGWTLAAAERVCDADVELLQSLVDKSLVRRWKPGRFGMLQTIREFAADQLEPARRDELIRRLRELLTETFEPNRRNVASETALMELALDERPNVDVALEWATAHREAEAGLDLISTLELYWATNDPIGARARIDALLELAGEDLDREVYARARRVRAATYDMTGQSPLAEPDYQRALDVFRELGDEREADHLLIRIAIVARYQADLERATRLSSEALERTRARGDRSDEAMALHNLAMVAFEQGEQEEGVRLAHEAAAAADSVGFAWWRGVTLLATSERLIAAGNLQAAKPEYREGLQTLADVPDLVNLPIALAAGAAIAAGEGDAVGAGMLWGAVETAGERDSRPTTSEALREYEPYVTPVGGADFEQGRAQGRRLSLEAAVEYALAAID